MLYKCAVGFVQGVQIVLYKCAVYIMHGVQCVFNRPGVAGAVIQTSLSLINSVTHSLTDFFF